jgi:hypothetical protein
MDFGMRRRNRISPALWHHGRSEHAPLLCYQITTGGVSFSPEPLEIVTNDRGHFVAAETLDFILGAFVYGHRAPLRFGPGPSNRQGLKEGELESSCLCPGHHCGTSGFRRVLS